MLKFEKKKSVAKRLMFVLPLLWERRLRPQLTELARSADRILARATDFSLFLNVQKGSGGPFSLLVNYYFPGSNQLKREGDHLSTPSAEVTNDCICTSTIPVCLYGVGKGQLYINPYTLKQVTNTLKNSAQQQK